MRTIRKLQGYLKKDFLLLYKRKKYLYTFILLPIIIALLFLLMLNPSQSNIKVGICDLDNTEISQQSFSNLDNFQPVLLDQENCSEILKDKIKSGELPLGIIIPQGFSDNINNLKQSRIIVYYDNTDPSFASLVSWKVDQSLAPFKKQIIDSLNSELKLNIKTSRTGFDYLAIQLSGLSSKFTDQINQIDSNLKNIEELETDFLINPIYTDLQPTYDQVFTKSAGIIFIFPIISLFIILMLASTSIIYDKKTGFLTKVKSSTTPSLYLLAKLIFFFILVAVQFIIILILFMAYGGTYVLSFQKILMLILSVSFINALLGLLIGMISENEGIAVLFSLIISFPLMLISGIFFPTQTLPRIIQYLGDILPLNYQINAAKSTLILNQAFSNYWIIGAAILFILIWWLIKKEN